MENKFVDRMVVAACALAILTAFFGAMVSKNGLAIRMLPVLLVGVVLMCGAVILSRVWGARGVPDEQPEVDPVRRGRDRGADRGDPDDRDLNRPRKRAGGQGNVGGRGRR